MAIIFREPLTLTEGTGSTIIPNTPLFGLISPSQTVTISLPQDVSTTSNVTFNQITANDKFIIDNESLTFESGIISGSITLVGNSIITNNLIGNDTLTVIGKMTAEKIETELSQSLFESGFTLFGDTSDDTHQFTGSVFISGSINMSGTNIIEISNDTLLSDISSTELVTENAIKSYVISKNHSTVQTYLRKSFVHTGSFINSSTSSFTAITASAPSNLTSTSESDFIFFINGQMMEHNAIAIQQKASSFFVYVDNNNIGYDLTNDDEVVAFGKFNS